MGTKNRRVAAYLPQEVDKAFVKFKIERGLASEGQPNQNDSQALIQLLSEFLGIAHHVAHSAAYLDNFATLEHLDTFRSVLVSQIGDLSSELELLKKQVAQLVKEADKKTDVCARKNQTELADHLGVDKSTVSHHKQKRDPESFLIWSRRKDPEGRGWIYLEHEQVYEQEPGSVGEVQGGLPLEKTS